MNKKSKIEEKIKLLPRRPGVYIMKDAEGEVIYVGKAKILKNRASSYFRGKIEHPRTRALVERIEDLEWIITDSEVEALILECNLIKEHKPKYNVMMTDDKHYPYIKVTLGEDFPRIMTVRSIKKDGAKYFGPYISSQTMNDALKVIKSIFPLRSCNNQQFNNRTRPCLNFQIKKCYAPCCGKISKEEYGEVVAEVVLLLEGKTRNLIRILTARMEEASGKLEFEKAARLRDQLIAVQALGEKQKVAQGHLDNQDFFAVFRGQKKACGQIFFVRNGKVVGREQFVLDHIQEMEEKEILEAFLKQYYQRAIDIPKEVYISRELEEQELLGEWLSSLKGSKVQIKVPKIGEKKNLIDLVAKNAMLGLLQITGKGRDEKKGMLELKEYLSLDRLPERIECFDISNIQGSNSVGSMVVFENGEPKPAEYRKFKIRSVEGPNDFASMEEVLTRRFQKLQSGDEKFSKIPDLLIIDGGKGQLSSARKILKKAGLTEIPTFGLAKKEELLFREAESEPIVLPRDSEALYMVQRIRDEAHRFAITFHRSLRGKEAIKSALDDIPGVGPKRKKALIDAFGTVKKIREATEEELLKVPGMNNKMVDILKDYLG